MSNLGVREKVGTRRLRQLYGTKHNTTDVRNTLVAMDHDDQRIYFTFDRWSVRGR